MRIKIDEAIKLLRTPGTYFSGSDWKYGFPHKFYVGHDKVYTKDLKLVPDEKVQEFSVLAQEFFGIEFYRQDKQLYWRCEWADCSAMGYQRAGHVGPDGKPIRNDDWNPDFPGRPVN